MNDGFIVLFRKIVSWEWYTDIPTKALFLHCLFKANWEDKKWRGMTVKRGSFITSREKLSKETGLSVQQVRSAIKKLKSTNEITYETTSNYSLITVVNYRVYQDYNPVSNQANNLDDNHQITNEQPTDNQRVTTTNNNNHYNKNNNITNNSNNIASSKDDATTIPPTDKTSKPTKKKYGEYKHVLLEDKQRDKLEQDLGAEMTLKCITYLDEYIEMKGYKAKNHYLCIRKWVIDAVKRNELNKPYQKGKQQNFVLSNGVETSNPFIAMLEEEQNE